MSEVVGEQAFATKALPASEPAKEESVDRSDQIRKGRLNQEASNMGESAHDAGSNTGFIVETGEVVVLPTIEANAQTVTGQSNSASTNSVPSGIVVSQVIAADGTETGADDQATYELEDISVTAIASDDIDKTFRSSCIGSLCCSQLLH
jgi:hypothetical protein